MLGSHVECMNENMCGSVNIRQDDHRAMPSIGLCCMSVCTVTINRINSSSFYE
jgi:hypothetical protein